MLGCARESMTTLLLGINMTDLASMGSRGQMRSRTRNSSNKIFKAKGPVPKAKGSVLKAKGPGRKTRAGANSSKFGAYITQPLARLVPVALGVFAWIEWC